MSDLSGRTAVVFGVGGVGGGIAGALAAAGMQVAVADVNGPAAAAVATRLTDGGAVAIACTADATNRTDIASVLSRAADELGGVNVVANTVAAITDRPLDRCSEDDWAWILETNVLSGIRIVDLALPHLRAARAAGELAHVVLTTSLAGLVTTPASQLRGGLHNGLYSTSKHALVGYADMLRHELAPEGIGVSLLAPGVVEGNLRSTAAALRPARYGGPEPDPQIGMIPKQNPMPAARVGRLVAAAIRANRFWVFTHPESRALVAARHAEIQAAFDELAELDALDGLDA